MASNFGVRSSYIDRLLSTRQSKQSTYRIKLRGEMPLLSQADTVAVTKAFSEKQEPMRSSVFTVSWKRNRRNHVTWWFYLTFSRKCRTVEPFYGPSNIYWWTRHLYLYLYVSTSIHSWVVKVVRCKTRNGKTSRMAHSHWITNATGREQWKERKQFFVHHNYRFQHSIIILLKVLLSEQSISFLFRFFLYLVDYYTTQRAVKI